MSGATRPAGHAFLSYVREDARRVERLQLILEAARIPVWRDKGSLWPGEDWRAKIRSAIKDDALVFIACFSKASLARSKSYWNAEFGLAIEELQRRRPDRPWLIPVRFDECDLPDWDIGGGRNLASVQSADVFADNFEQGAARLVAVVLELLGPSPAAPGRTAPGRTAPGRTAPGRTKVPREARPGGGQVSLVTTPASGDNSPPPGSVVYGVTMLGPQYAGKTTFLAALQVALLRQAEPKWQLRGADPHSRGGLNKLMSTLTDRQFPHPTDDIEHYRCVLTGQFPRAIRQGRWRDKPVKVTLDLADVPGGIVGYDAEPDADLPEELLDNLARSAGVMIFYDPVSDQQQDLFAGMMFWVLTQMSRLADRYPDGKLPHYVAVCVTKFDDIQVFDRAQEMQLVQYDPRPPRLPRVPEQSAREFFERLNRLSASPAAGIVLPLLEQTFRPGRIRYFVTSAIGFYVDPQVGTYYLDDPDEFQDSASAPWNGADSIRGPVQPINVLEPVLWLIENMAKVAEERR